MSIFNFTLPNGQPFTVKGPPGLTEAQARQVFDQQASAGSLVGLKRGDVISAATQAAAGLTSALSQVGQAAAGFAGSATGALQGALQSLPGTQALGLGAAAGQVSGLLQSAVGAPPNLSGALSTAVGIGTKAVAGITQSLNTTAVTNGINAADFAKQGAALAGMGSLAVPDVTATVAQVGKLANQAAGAVSNAVGVGKFGLDANQLEVAGLVKPGTAAQFLSSGVNNLTSVLKSPAVWTGKSAISSLEGLLASVPKQNEVQQQLMATGLNGIKQLGIPTDKLSAGALAGTVANAAKSIPDTLAWSTGAALPGDLKSKFDITAKDVSFATNFAAAKLPDVFKEQTIPIPAADTVSRETVNAAASRVTGNPKIPAVDFGRTAPAINQTTYAAQLADIRTAYSELLDQALAVAKTPEDDAKNRALDLIFEIDRIESEATALEGRLLELERQGKFFVRTQGSNPSQSEIDKLKGDIAFFISTFDTLRSVFEEYLTQS